jgi:hypothetical protein
MPDDVIVVDPTRRDGGPARRREQGSPKRHEVKRSTSKPATGSWDRKNKQEIVTCGRLGLW